MINYTFDQRFVPLITEGLKVQTFRAPRLRHARPGEPMALQDINFRPILPDPVCRSVTPCEISWRGNRIESIRLGGVRTDLQRFAVADGFADVEDMTAWMRQAFGAVYIEGVLIEWSVSAAALVQQLETA